MIKMQNISKTFKVTRRGGGFREAARNLLSRQYETVHALDNICLNIGDGEMVGYIGPNGAGKSTTIKIMCGVLTPDCGICNINGYTPWQERSKYVSSIGVVFGQRSQLWWDVPVIDSFEMIREIYKVPDKKYKENLEELIEILNLHELITTPTRSLSLGQRMRCEIAASLLHSPKILFLDEPTIGLDAISKIAIRQFIKKLNVQYGTTVILTTHDMQDVEELANRIVLIGKGKILLDGELNEVKNRFSDSKRICVDYVGAAFKPHKYMGLKKTEKGHCELTINPKTFPVSDALSYITSQVDVKDISITGISTEEMVAKLYKEYQV